MQLHSVLKDKFLVGSVVMGRVDRNFLLFLLMVVVLRADHAAHILTSSLDLLRITTSRMNFHLMAVSVVILSFERVYVSAGNVIKPTMQAAFIHLCLQVFLSNGAHSGLGVTLPTLLDHELLASWYVIPSQRCPVHLLLVGRSKPDCTFN